MPAPAAADPAGALLRHFTDLRDRTHGGVSSRREKEELFARAVPLIDPYARRALDEINQHLLLGTGQVAGTGVRPQAAGGIEAEWTLTWPLQRAAGIAPVTLRAHYGTAFHHPHLRSGTVGDWPLNVFDEAQAAAEGRRGRRLRGHRRGPMDRIAEAAEIKGPALFLASAASDYMTGQTLVVDGGCLAK